MTDAEDRADRLDRNERLDRMESRQIEQGERLVRIEDSVDHANGKLARVTAEVGYGLPEPSQRGERRSLRNRVHDLENERRAGEIARQALTAAKKANSQAWTRWQKILLFVFAVATTTASLLRLAGFGG